MGHKNWRLEAQIGSGHLVDWGIHLIDATRITLGEKTPRMVRASGGLYRLKGMITTPDTLTANFEFATCPVTWRHRLWGSAEFNPEVNNSMFFYGEKETVFVTDNRWIVIPVGKGERRVTEAKSDAGTRHMADFLGAVRTRRKLACVPEDGFYSTATVQLAMIAYRSGGRVDWDAARKQIAGNAQGGRLLMRFWRAPYKHRAA